MPCVFAAWAGIRPPPSPTGRSCLPRPRRAPGRGASLGLKAYLVKDQGHLDEAQRLREKSPWPGPGHRERTGKPSPTTSSRASSPRTGPVRGGRRFLRTVTPAQPADWRSGLPVPGAEQPGEPRPEAGDLGTAEALYRTNLKLQQSLASRYGEALALNNLGVIALMAVHGRGTPRPGPLRPGRGPRRAGHLPSKPRHPGLDEGPGAGLWICMSVPWRSRKNQARYCSCANVSSTAEPNRLQRRFSSAWEGYQRVLHRGRDARLPRARLRSWNA